MNNVAGRKVTTYLEGLLKTDNIGVNISNAGGWAEICRDFKEKHCFVAADIEKAREEAKNSGVHKVEYELPNGEKIVVNAPRFEAPEALFTPDNIDK